MKSKIFVALFLAIVMIASACTGSNKTGSYSQTEGLVITKFQAIPPQVYNEEPVTLELEVLNKGGPGIPARNVEAYVLNMNFGGFNLGSAGAAEFDVKTTSTQTSTTTVSESSGHENYKVVSGNIEVRVMADYTGKKVVRLYRNKQRIKGPNNENIVFTCEENVNPCIISPVSITADTTEIKAEVGRYKEGVQDNFGGVVISPPPTAKITVVYPGTEGAVGAITLGQAPTATTTKTTTSTSSTDVKEPPLNWRAGEVSGASKDGALKAIPDSTQWFITPGKETARTLDVTYNPRVRVCYQYQTEATTKAKVVRLEELRAQQQRGDTTQTDISTQNSGGPIQMKVTTRQPIILRDSDAGKLKLTVDVLNVNPTAGGLAYVPTSEGSCLLPAATSGSPYVKGGKNKVILAAEIVGTACDKVESIDLTNSAVRSSLPAALVKFIEQNNVPQTACLKEVTLSDGKRGIANYMFDIGSVVGEQEITVRLTAFYGYYTEADARFSVQPLPQ